MAMEGAWVIMSTAIGPVLVQYMYSTVQYTHQYRIPVLVQYLFSQGAVADDGCCGTERCVSMLAQNKCSR